MKEVRTVGGNNAFYVQTRVCVTRITFALALTNYFWSEDKYIGLKTLSKSKAESILRSNLARHGTEGGIEYMQYESYEPGEGDLDLFVVRAECFTKVDELFPYLK